ncbi:MAG TPA: hypothetical protein VK155_20130 [Bacteroidales bacterium]|jgi:hypothetical protein|nr:hypothetical protein [Bacteroidales bacterium]
METITLNQTETQPGTRTVQRTNHKPGNEGFNRTALDNVFTLLKLTFVIVPVVAGIDKFTNLLTDWEKYLNPSFAGLLPFSGAVFMKIVGVIEIVAGILVFSRPSVGGLVVAAWLAMIALTILASGNYLDIAVRDLVMAISAFSMSRLAKFSQSH